jgi:predicted nucleic acid-binding protein
MVVPLIADTGGLLRAIATKPNGRSTWPDFERALRTASRVIVPALVLAEVDYFLRGNRAAMRALVSDIFDPATAYEFEATTPEDVARAMALDRKFHALEIGLVDGVVCRRGAPTGLSRSHHRPRGLRPAESGRPLHAAA